MEAREGWKRRGCAGKWEERDWSWEASWKIVSDDSTIGVGETRLGIVESEFETTVVQVVLSRTTFPLGVIMLIPTAPTRGVLVPCC